MSYFKSITLVSNCFSQYFHIFFNIKYFLLNFVKMLL
ncbi:GSCOCG00001198001-RA-CDS [Cotesia congregata]|nr:GSCOCG00001198001-RA-CDS [Cotesia congregata]